MSINGSLSGITFGGLSSGIDTDGIISRLMQIEAIPLQRLQFRQQQLSAQQGVYSQFRGALQALSTASGSLNNAAAFNPISASSSDTEVATITGSSSAVAGTYSLTVSKLAQAQKVSSAAQTDTTTALGQAGKFVVNGRMVEVVASDSLRTVAQKINEAGAGVVASLIDGGAGNAYLTLSSGKTGASNKIQIADVSGTVLSNLGVVSGVAAIRETVTNGATSTAFTSSTTAVGTLMSASGIGAASFTVNGTQVDVDLSTDNLQQIADKVNAAVTGVTATVRSVTKDGSTVYKLDIVGTAGTPTFADVSGNALAALGVVQQGYANSLVTAQDAEYKLDGVSLTSSSNTVSTAIPGATLTLLKADVTEPETSTLTLTRDTTAVKGKIKEFTEAYNNAVGFIRQYSAFDKDTFDTGPLFGDPVAQRVEQAVNNLVFGNVPGLTGTYTNLTTLGFKVDNEGKLSFDEGVLTQAIENAPEAVGNLFRSTGLGSTTDLQYVSSNGKTVATGTGSYDVSITALATKGSYVGELAQTAPSTVSEILTFSGSLFGSTPYKLTLPVGSTLADTISKINNDATLRELVTASDDGGKLKVESKRYGVAGNFTLVSDFEAAADNSGIGVGSLGTVVLGTDIVGTINGEAATGSGQFLTGNTGNANTEGLQILYTGTATGMIGTVSLRKGVGTQMNDLMGLFTDSVSGMLTATDQSLTTQADDIKQQITDLKSRLELKQVDLRTRFTAMEQAISRLQGQASRLGALSIKTN
jgi:flagellar hook-associated protein 2